MISIITPCRNSEKTIRRTIESVINQGITDYEYIIVDGLSTDKTMEIVEEYASNNDKVKYISEKDNSMTEALNKGFKMAKGDIVCSINADDEYCEGALACVEKVFSDTRADVVVGATNWIKDGKIFFSTYPRFMCNRFLLNVLDCSAPECSMFFRRKVLEKESFFDEKYKYTQDYELYIRLAQLKYKYVYTNQTVSRFYLSDEQYSTSAYDKMLEEACVYNEHPILFRLLKISHLNNVIKRVFGWTKMGE